MPLSPAAFPRRNGRSISTASRFASARDGHIDRCPDDPRNAQVIAKAIADTPGLRLEPPEVETNLVWVEVESDLGTGKEVVAALKQRGVLIHHAGPQTFRACTHLDV